MARPIPSSVTIPNSSIAQLQQHADGLSSWTMNCRVITPMFGGGHTAGAVDPVTPISAKAIRGHLRFWWRATRGAACRTVDDLAHRESEIFCQTDRRSLVSVVVSKVQAASSVPVQEWWQDSNSNRPKEWRVRWRQELNPIAYALFPFQITELVRKAHRESLHHPPDDVFYRCVMDLTFSVELSAPKSLEADLRAAVWAWLTFGGIGARTRRGLGSLCCDGSDWSDLIPPAGSDFSMWILAQRSEHCVDAGRQNCPWPTLTASGIHVSQVSTIKDAMEKGVGSLFKFRQGSIGRNRGGTSNAGRSSWPEPESIRNATGYRLNKPDRNHPEEPEKPSASFPRAEFGLPIVFHFKDGDERDPSNTRAEPFDTMLLPVVDGKRRNRMASPLIVKAMAAGGSKAVPIIVLLKTPQLENADLVRQANDATPVIQIPSRGIRPASNMKYLNSPISSASGTVRTAVGSAIEAFLAFIQEPNNGYRKADQP